MVSKYLFKKFQMIFTRLSQSDQRSKYQHLMRHLKLYNFYLKHFFLKIHSFLYIKAFHYFYPTLYIRMFYLIKKLIFFYICNFLNQRICISFFVFYNNNFIYKPIKQRKTITYKNNQGLCINCNNISRISCFCLDTEILCLLSSISNSSLASRSFFSILNFSSSS